MTDDVCSQVAALSFQMDSLKPENSPANVAFLKNMSPTKYADTVQL